MARARRSGRSSGVDYNWGGSFLELTASSTAITTAILGGVTAVFSNAQTIRRIRGGYTAFVDGATKTSDSMLLCLGIIVVSNAAAVAGVASVPSPATDPEDDWMWHQVVPLMSVTASPSGLQPVQVSGSVRGEIDSKAMRRVRAGETLILVADGVSLDAGLTYSVAAGCRILTSD